MAKRGKASRKGSRLPDCGGGWPAWLGWCSSSNSVFSGLQREEGLRFSFFFFSFFSRKGTRVLCLFQHGRHSHSQGHRFSCSPGCQVDLSQSPQVLCTPRRTEALLPPLASAGPLPWLLTAFAQCCFCLSPMTPRVQTEGRSFFCSLDATEAAF